MGIRVRKLARELRTSPEGVLSLLQQLGYERYRSPEDMVSDVVAAKLRSASPSSREPPRAPDPARPPPPGPGKPPGAPSGDVMASLVPGVVRTEARRSAPGPTYHELATERLAAERQQLAAERQQLAAERQQLAAEQQQLATEQQRLAAERQQLATEQQRLATEQQRLAAERQQLVAERQPQAGGAHGPAEPVGACAPGQGPPGPAEPGGSTESVGASGGARPLLELFHERGLRGIDEAERALGVLATTRSLGRILEGVQVVQPEGFARILRDRLVLVGGALPDTLDLPAVIVSADRGDLPGGDDLARRCRAVGEQLMLLGLTRVVLLGIAPRWHALLRAGIDARVHLMFRSSAGDLTRGEADAIMSWGRGLVPEPSQQAPRGARLRVLEIEARDLGAWMEAVAQALSQVG